MSVLALRQQTGDCDCCENTAVIVTLSHGMWMCDDCKGKNDTAVSASVNTMIAQSREVDSTIQVKTDIFIAQTVPAIELRGAIDADENIPADQKDYTFAKECMSRFKHLQQVIFEERQALLEKENQLRMWQVQVQTTAGKLRAEYREQFKALDIQYQPAKPKTVKTPSTRKPSSGSKKFNMDEVRTAALKYDVPADGTRMIMVSRNMSAEDAAKTLAQMLGKIK